MYHSYHNHLLFSNLHVPLSLTNHHYPSLFHLLHKPTTSLHTVSAIPPISSSITWFTQLASITEELELGPIELPFSTSTFGATDDPSKVQVASTVVLTGAITFFLFRAVQRRAKRAKALKFRSSGVKKLDGLKAMESSSIKVKKAPPSPDQALIGAVIAGVIAVILYRFTTTIEASLGRQTLSDNFSVRQITITIRTIINGLCYLATFVYGINSVGLLLYSGQLALNTFVGDQSTSGRKEAESSKIIANSPVENSNKEDQSSSNSQ